MEVKTRIPGVVRRFAVNPGDQVKKGDIIMVLEAMKMAQRIPAPVDGEVTEFLVAVDDHVKAGQVLAVIEE